MSSVYVVLIGIFYQNLSKKSLAFLSSFETLDFCPYDIWCGVMCCIATSMPMCERLIGWYGQTGWSGYARAVPGIEIAMTDWSVCRRIGRYPPRDLLVGCKCG